jgi:hypothetical protein
MNCRSLYCILELLTTVSCHSCIYLFISRLIAWRVVQFLVFKTSGYDLRIQCQIVDVFCAFSQNLIRDIRSLYSCGSQPLPFFNTRICLKYKFWLKNYFKHKKYWTFLCFTILSRVRSSVTNNFGVWIWWLGLFDVTNTITLGCNSSHIQLLLDHESLTVVCILHFCTPELLPARSVIFHSREDAFSKGSVSRFRCNGLQLLVAAGTEAVR